MKRIPSDQTKPKACPIMQKNLYIAAAVTALRNDLNTLILCATADDEKQMEGIVRATIQRQHPQREIINITIAQAPDWLEEYYSERSS